MSIRMRMRNVCFTAWCEIDDIKWDDTRMSYLIIGKEICPKTKQCHLQGYLEMKGQVDFKVLKKLLGDTTHLEKRKKSAVAASEYCKKDGDYQEWGTLSKQGKRKDLDDVIDDIQSGISIKTIARGHPCEYIKYHKGIEKLRNHYIEPRSWVTEVIVLYGETGTGKSRLARELCTDYWVWSPLRGEWFDGYDGNAHVIMEEFRGQLKLGMMLSLLDRYECPVQVKGGTVEFCPRKIVITSPKHPNEWYENAHNDRTDQLLRRITEIKEIKR